MGSLKIGLIGCGSWGRYILRDLKKLDCEVAVLARSERSRQRAVEGEADVIVDRFESLPDVHGFVVSTTTSTHAEAIDQLLKFDRPIYCEKPIADDPVAAQKIVEQAGDRVFVMDKWRYHPGIQLMGEIAKSGELGGVIGLKTNRLGWGYSHFDTDPVWILLPHDLSIAHEVLGGLPEPRYAVAEQCDIGLAGMTALLGDAPWHLVEIGVRSERRHRTVELLCTKGIVRLDDPYDDYITIVPNPTAFANAPNPEPERRTISTEFPLLRELRAFRDYLRQEGPPPRSSAHEGFRTVQVIAELRRLAGVE